MVVNWEAESKVGWKYRPMGSQRLPVTGPIGAIISISFLSNLAFP